MIDRLIVTPDAEEDIDAATAWYRDAGLGVDLEFVRALDARLSAIARFPFACPVIHRGARKAVLRRFPYYLVYTIFDETVVVIACFHARRDPEDWKSRV